MPGKIFLYAPTPVTSASIISALGYTPADVAGSTGNFVVTGTTQTGSSANSFVSITGTWNTTGTPTADLLNVTDTASNAASLLMDRQVNGVSIFSVSKSAVRGIYVGVNAASQTANNFALAYDGTYTILNGQNNSTGLLLAVANNWGLFVRGGAIVNSPNNVSIPNSWAYGWSANNASSGIMDLFLNRDAAGVLALKNSTTAQGFRVYNTYTDTANYKRGAFDWTTTAGTLTIGAQTSGTGGSAGVNIVTTSVTALTLAANGNATFSGSVSTGSDVTLGGTGGIVQSKTITAAGTTGAQTINKNSGSVNFAAGATSLVVTDSQVSTSTVIQATVATNDATMKSVQVVAAAGSFTLYANAAATAETRVNFSMTF